MSASTRRTPSGIWSRGAPDAPVELLEFGDYECPHCGRAFGELERLELAAGDELRFAYRHFPLTQVHPHAMLAAEAAEAAGAQGRFWQMHTTLYRNQDQLEGPALLRYAGALGLDMARFVSDLESHRYEPKIRRDFMDGVRMGVNGTPTFFINGQRYDGVVSADALLGAIRGEPAFPAP